MAESSLRNSGQDRWGIRSKVETGLGVNFAGTGPDDWGWSTTTAPGTGSRHAKTFRAGGLAVNFLVSFSLRIVILTDGVILSKHGSGEGKSESEVLHSG